MAGLHAPLPTLRRHPRGRRRTARGRCGSLLLHRSGLAPPTPCRSPGALAGDDLALGPPRPLLGRSVVDEAALAQPRQRLGSAAAELALYQVEHAAADLVLEVEPG